MGPKSSRRIIAVALLALVCASAVTSVFLKPNNVQLPSKAITDTTDTTNSSNSSSSMAALQVPTAPVVEGSKGKPKPGETGLPTPFPTVVLPSMTPVLPGSDVNFDTEPSVGQRIPLPTHAPSDPLVTTMSAMRALSVEGSTKRAGVIAIGTVKEVGPARWTTPDGLRPANPWADDNRHTIFTPVRVSVDTVVKGADKGNQLQELTLWSFGGTVGKDSITWNSDDLYAFAVGDRVVVFIEQPNEASPIQSVNGRTLWQVVDRYSVRDGQAVNKYHKMPLDQLISEILSVR